MDFIIRKATTKDQSETERLIAQSVRGLSGNDYTTRQIELSIKSVFGIDTDLINDNTYLWRLPVMKLLAAAVGAKEKRCMEQVFIQAVGTRTNLTQK